MFACQFHMLPTSIVLFAITTYTMRRTYRSIPRHGSFRIAYVSIHVVSANACTMNDF